LALLDIFGKKDVSADLTRKNPYAIKISFHPLRISANKSDTARMTIRLENRSNEPLLTAVVVQTARAIGLDPTCISTTREIRVGEMAGGEVKEIPVDVYGSMKTDPGEYDVAVTAISHYRNYSQVLNSEKKVGSLRVV